LAITKTKIKIYQLLADIIIKFVLAIVAVIAFIIVLIYLLKPTNPPLATATLGLFEALLTATLYKVYTHYFPKKTK